MEELKRMLENCIDEKLEQVVLSNSRDKEKIIKVKIRPVLIQGEVLFQETTYIGNQVFHKNTDREQAIRDMIQYLQEDFRQGEIRTEEMQGTVLVSKKGKITVNTKKRKECGDGSCRIQDHNRTKKYILEEGKPVDFLIGLGVQTAEGKIVRSKYDKFRQINRYLEFVEDVYGYLPADRTVRIIDFGCGKSYLTFALYYYLHELKKRDVRITGLDLKKDVIDHCNQLARKYGYENLKFETGNISTYEGEEKADMVVSLHACNTATDFALEKAIRWGAGVILAVPCCQHELNEQIQYPPLEPAFRYGIIRERMAALLTDAIRADLLEEQGYDTQIMEFIDIENTPKNLLIRAVRRKNPKDAGTAEKEKKAVSKMISEMHIHPTLQVLLEEHSERNGEES